MSAVKSGGSKVDLEDKITATLEQLADDLEILLNTAIQTLLENS